MSDPQGLRLRRADAAPSAGLDQYWARVPESVITDRDLCASAVRVYAALALRMAEARNPTLCLDPMGEIARTAGVSERQCRRLIAALEARGHVARERVRTIAGAPQGIRPLARLKSASNRTPLTADRSPLTDCNRTPLTAAPVTHDRPTDANDRATGHRRPGLLKREQEKDSELKIGPRPAAEPGEPTRRPEAAKPTDHQAEPDAQADADAQADPEALAAALADLRAKLPALGARKGPGGNRQVPPRPESRGHHDPATGQDSTAPAPKSTDEHD